MSPIQGRLPGLRRRVERLVPEPAPDAAPEPASGPAVSIVLPVYNVEEWLPACLDSIAAQTFSDYELLVIDDGSPDGSRAIAEQYAEKDPRVRIVVRENGGLGAARNTGIREAIGEYLTFVDSDDLLPPSALEALVNAARADRVDLVTGSVVRFDGANTWAPNWVEDVHAERRTSITVTEFLPLLRNLYTWNKLFRRDFWDECGLWFREAVAYEDQPIVTELFARARSITVIPDVVYTYRVRPDSSSISQQIGTIKDLRDRIAAWEATREVLVAEHERAIYDGWLQTLFTAHFHWYLNAPALVDEGYWSELRAAILDFIADAPQETWDATPPSRRVMLELVRLNRRADAQAFVDAGGRNLDRWPATARADGLLVELPFRGDPELPDSLFLLRPAQMRLAHRIETLRWIDKGCEISGWAYLRKLDLRDRSSEVEVVLRNERSGEERVARGEAHASLFFLAPFEDGLCDYDRGGFRALLPIAELVATSQPGDAWTTYLRVSTAGFTATAPASDLVRPTQLSARPAGPGRRVAADSSPGHPLRFRVEDVRLGVSDVVLSGRTLTGTLAGPATAHLDHVALVSGESEATAALGRRGSFRLELPPRTDESVTWHLQAVRDNRRQLRPSIADASWSDVIVAGPDGGLQLRRTRRNTLSVVESAFGAVADCIAVEGETLRVTGSAFGATSVALTLPGLAGRATGPWADVYDGRFDAQLDLRQDAWRFGRLPLARGDHELAVVLTGESGPVEAPLVAADALVAQIPTRIDTGAVQGRLALTPAGVVRLVVVRPLGAARSKRAQVLLRESAPTVASTPGVLFRTRNGEAATGDGLAIHHELRRRGTDLPLWWGVLDHSVPVPEGGTAVIVHSPQWHELLRSVSHYVEDAFQPLHHRKPQGQVILRTGDGFPAPELGRPDFERGGLPPGRRATVLAQVADWDFLLAPPDDVRALLKDPEFTCPGQVLDIGSPRTDLLQGTGATALRDVVRRSLGVGAHQKAVLYAPSSGATLLDLEKAAQRLGDDWVLVARCPAPRDVPGVVDVSAYPELSDLMLAADIAVFDPSGPVTDFAVTGKPIVLHGPDLPAGEPDENAMGPQTATTDDLVDVLENLGSHTEQHQPAYQRYREEHLALNDGHAAARLVDLLFE